MYSDNAMLQGHAPAQ